MSDKNGALVRFIDVQKTFDGETLVVKNLNVDVAEGEFLTLLGPSGSGKTTTLLMLAGFETITHGDITLGGKVFEERAAVQTQHWHGVSKLCPLSSHDR